MNNKLLKYYKLINGKKRLHKSVLELFVKPGLQKVVELDVNKLTTENNRLKAENEYLRDQNAKLLDLQVKDKELQIIKAQIETGQLFIEAKNTSTPDHKSHWWNFKRKKKGVN